MSDIRIRNVDESLKAFIKADAKSAGLTMEEYLRDLVRQRRTQVREGIAKDLHAGRRKLLKKYGLFSNSAALIRAEREENGW